MARILERELYDRLFRPRHKIAIFGPGLSPDIDGTTLYLCHKNTNPDGRVIMVDSQIGDPRNFQEEPGMARHTEKAMELKLESGGEGNARHHLEQILAFKENHPSVHIKTPEIHWASAFKTELPDDSVNRTLNRGGLFWMVSGRKEGRTVKDALRENLRILKPGGIGVVLNEDSVLPDKDLSWKIRFALESMGVPFEEYEIQHGFFQIGSSYFQPVYRYNVAFKFTKPLKTKDST